MAQELDYMEYPNDGAAQAAYPTSADAYGPDVTPNMTSNTAPEPNVTSATNFHSPYDAWRAFDGVKDDYGYISQQDAALPIWIKFDFGAGNSYTVTKYTIWCSPATASAPKDWTFQGSNNDSDWDTLDTVIGETGWSSYEDRSFTFSNSTAYRYYRLNVSANNGGTGFVLYITEIEMYESITPALQCYSESTIKQQGSYSLKVIAAQTESLNETLTRTVAPGVDLSGINTLELYVYASRTGTNIEVKIHDSGGNTITISIVITSAETMTKIVKDISGVADADKDDIDEIKIEIIEASALNTFYVDDFTGVEIAAYPIARLNKNRITGYHCFMDQYLRASRLGLTPLKLPDGTVF